MAKIGRNVACPCGSGRKYKHCHGSFTPGLAELPPHIEEELQRARRTYEARDLLRKTQQGFGKPIISATVDGIRVVAVGNKIYQSKRWRFFTDFLIDYAKDAMGRDWGRRRSKEGYAHPLFRWLQRLDEERTGHVGDVVVRKEVGYLTSIFRLGYALYLIAHHDQLAGTLVGRLRVHDTFNAAYCEALAFASFAVAGFSVSWAEHEKSIATPEFWAIGPSGKRYGVEAKFKNGWRSPPTFASTAFRTELRQWLRDKLHLCLKKRLENLIIWLELGVADPPLSEAEWRQVDTIIAETLAEAESMTLEGDVPPSAYVFVTNNAHLVNDDIPHSPTVAFLQGYRMESMKGNRFVDLELGMEYRDANREVVRVFECLQEVQRVPTTFDGTPQELLRPDGTRSQVLEIGQRLDVRGMSANGAESVEIIDIVSMGDKATIIAKDNLNRTGIYTVPLSTEEQEAVKRYGDVVFGNTSNNGNVGGNPIRLYDWLLKTFSSYDKDGLANQIPGHPMLAQIRLLPLDEMRIRVAREATKMLSADRQQGQSSNT